jgi:hypothetical protein
MSNPVVFFDMTIGGAPAGRIEMTVSLRPNSHTVLYRTKQNWGVCHVMVNGR